MEWKKKQTRGQGGVHEFPTSSVHPTNTFRTTTVKDEALINIIGENRFKTGPDLNNLNIQVER